MLPNFETCRKHILAYKRKIENPRPNTISFPGFWSYKAGLESAGQSILAEKHLENTASMLCALMKYLKIRNPGLAEVSRVKPVMRDIRPYYSDICRISLGSGEIPAFRCQIESIFERLDGTAGAGAGRGHKLSIAGKSAILMAIWGQVPRLDSLNRIRFERWTHWPDPEKLPYLEINRIWYQPDEFSAMVEEMDKWVAAWPETNYSKSFPSGFFDLCPGIPPGRQIDIIYHWKIPESWVDYRLQSQGSFLAQVSDNSINEYLLD